MCCYHIMSCSCDIHQNMCIPTNMYLVKEGIQHSLINYVSILDPLEYGSNYNYFIKNYFDKKSFNKLDITRINKSSSAPNIKTNSINYFSIIDLSVELKSD